MVIKGNIVDVVSKEIFPGEIHINKSRIDKIIKVKGEFDNFILPGLIDSHVHVESSMLVPSRFAELVVPRGTVAVVSDPHEIANVMGVKGVEYMIDDAAKVPLKCFFGVPSCVPATNFETSGHVIAKDEVEYLLKQGAPFLAEMMNFPGVINGEKGVVEKLELAKKYNVPIDGHAPGVKGGDIIKYAEGGITTDHESFSVEEAVEKIKVGIKTQIREGSAARNFEALHTLIREEPTNTMLCTDDSHPDLIIEKGHIDRLIRLGLSKGYTIFELFQVAVVNPIQHYNLPVGLLKEGDQADFIVVDNLEKFNVLSTYIDGRKVGEHDLALFEMPVTRAINNFSCSSITLNDLHIIAPNDNPSIKTIVSQDGELLTGECIWNYSCKKGEKIHHENFDDISKIVVVNRYKDTKPVVGYIKNFGLKQGALASSVAHDSHNVVAIGKNDEDLLLAINGIIEEKGGIIAVNNGEKRLLNLPVAGLMTTENGRIVAEKYAQINDFVSEMGCKMKAPFMTLAFMSLLVIPSLKIGDRGLFDVNTFSFTSLFVNE